MSSSPPLLRGSDLQEIEARAAMADERHELVVWTSLSELNALVATVRALREALEPFAVMARDGDALEPQASQMACGRGVASDMTVIRNCDWYHAAAVFGATE